MSWLGAHPILSKAAARAILPPAACKRCVYWVRVHGPENAKLCHRCSDYPEGRGVRTMLLKSKWRLAKQRLREQVIYMRPEDLDDIMKWVSGG